MPRNESTIAKNGRITLKEIARLAGVSVSTASTVLSGKSGERRISAEAERRVREVAMQHDYAPNLLVRSLQQGQTHVLSFYSAFHNRESDDIYMDRISAAMERAAGQRHYDVLVHCDFSHPVEDLYRALNGGRSDGLIFFGPTDGNPLVPLLRSSRLPTVLLNRRDEAGALSSVSDDMPSGMRQVADALLGRGHRRIAAITGAAGVTALSRVDALRTLLADAGLSLPERWIVPVTGNDPNQADAALRALLDEPEPPTALFCWHDRVGYLMLEACERLGIKVPERLSLVGYDGLHWPSTSRHVLASVVVDVDMLAENAVYVLDNLIQGRATAPVVQVHPASLALGTTLAAAPETGA